MIPLVGGRKSAARAGYKLARAQRANALPSGLLPPASGKTPGSIP